jgi:hypothetical protein
METAVNVKVSARTMVKDLKVHIVITIFRILTSPKTRISFCSRRRLALLDGRICERGKCTDYLRDRKLEALELTGGHLRLSYDPDSNDVYVITEYQSGRELTQEELNLLKKETQSQWSDGIGEDGFSNLETELGLDVNLSHRLSLQDISIEQETVTLSQPRKKSPISLFVAIREKDISKLRAAIKAGAPVNETFDNCYALTTAVHSNFLEGAQALLLAGADPNCRSIVGSYRTVHYAATARITDDQAVRMAQMLLKHGTKLDMKEDRFKPLVLARESKKTKLAQFYKAQGGQE